MELERDQAGVSVTTILPYGIKQSTRPHDGVDSLFAPVMGGYVVRGEFDGITIPGNGYTRTFEFHPMRQQLAVAGMLLAAWVRRAGRGVGAPVFAASKT